MVIIGAGFTGLSTAWHLIDRVPGRRVVVLEAGTVGNGASGRNSGMALHWIDGPPADPERILRHHAVTDGTIDWIEGMIRDHAPEVGFARSGSVELVTDPRRIDAARDEAARLAPVGVRWLEGDELRARLDAVGAVGAAWDPRTAVLHGLAWCRALARLAEARGVAIHERSPAIRIDPGPIVVTPGGSVRAPIVVLATNAYTPALGWFRTGVFPLHSHVVATEPLPPDRWRELGWGDVGGFSDDLDRIAFGAIDPAGRLVFGGGSNRAYGYRFGGGTTWDGPAGHDAVIAVLCRYFPRMAGLRIDHRWTGALGLTLHRGCSIGSAGPVFHALGYSGHGVVLANLAGRVLADLVDGRADEWRDLPFFDRVLGGIPPEPLRWLGYEIYTRLTGRSPRRHGQ